MSVHTCVSSSAGEVLSILVGDMLSSPWLSVSFCQSEVDNVHVVLFLPNPDQEVVRLDVSMQEMSTVHILYSLNHLICKHQNRFERELSLAVVKEIFKRRAQKVYHHNVIVSFYPKPMHIWDSYPSLEDSVQLGFIQ